MDDRSTVPGPEADDTAPHHPDEVRRWRHRLLAPYLESGVVGLWEERPHQNIWYVRGQVVVDNEDIPLLADQLQRLEARPVDGTTLPCARLARRLRTTTSELVHRVPAARRYAGLRTEGLGSTVFALPGDVDVVELVLRWRSDLDLPRAPSVWPNHVVTAFQRRLGFPDTDPEPGPGLPDVPPAKGAPGEGTVVAVLDTGFVPKDKRSPAITWFDGDTWEAELDEVDAFGDPRLLDAEAGHGLFVAGLVKRMAPGARVHFVKAINSEGVGTEQGVAAAIRRAAAQQELHVMNLSLGYATLDNAPPAELVRQLRRARERHPGLAVVAAAGNDGDTSPRFPAACKEVVGVGGLDRYGRAVADTSNRGPWVDVYAPSRALHSCFPSGTEDDDLTLDGNADTFEADARWSGTSFAAPLVAGLVARAVSPGGGAPPTGTADAAATALMVPLPETPGEVGKHLSPVTFA